MAIKYRLEPIHDNINGKKEAGFLPVVVKGPTVSLEMLARQIARQSSFTAGDVLGILRNLVDLVPDYLLMGCNVNLEGLGTLWITAALREKALASEAVTGRQVQVKKVNFRNSPVLRKRMKEAVFEKYVQLPSSAEDSSGSGGL